MPGLCGSLQMLGTQPHDPVGEDGAAGGPVLGVCVRGLFESPVVLHALFGRAARTLEDTFDALAELVDRHLGAAVLQRWLAGRA